jgi:formylglycine-generating enzyme required for sulfatase activity
MSRTTLNFTALLVLLAGAPATFAQEDGADPSDDDRTVRRLGDVVGGGENEFSMDALPPVQAPARDRPDLRLPDPDRDERLQALLDRVVAEGRTTAIDGLLAELMDEVRAAAIAAVDAGDLAAARARQAVLAELAPELGVADEIAAAQARRERASAALAAVDDALSAGRLVGGGEAALNRLIELRRLAPDAADTQAATERVRGALRQRFDALLDGDRLDAATDLVAAIERTGSSGLPLSAWREALATAAGQRIDELLNQARGRLDATDPAGAAEALAAAARLGAADTRLAPLREALARQRRYGRFEPGQRFSDERDGGDRGPEMVVVPAGSAMLGSPRGEPGRFEDEGPRYRARLDRGFALSTSEITVGQFRAFVRATDYRTDAERNRASNVFDPQSGALAPQRNATWRQDFLGEPAADNLPVVHVSWTDARAYVEWLAESTGQPYRLPSEAEFEYALRGGTQTRFWWGDGAPERVVENLAGENDRFAGGQRWNDAFADYRDGFWGAAPVRSFRPNPYGLHDIGGNLLEWVADCWIDDYLDPPTDGRPRTRGDCDRRVLRGGAWSNGPATSRSAYRLSGPTDFSDARVGFRVARDLLPPGE